MDNPFLRPSPVFTSSSANRFTPTNYTDRGRAPFGQANDYQYRNPFAEGTSSSSTSNIKLPSANLFARDNYLEALSASQRFRMQPNVYATKQLNIDNSFTGRLPYQSSKNPFTTDSFTPKRDRSFLPYDRPPIQSYQPVDYRVSRISQASHDSSNCSYVDKLLLYTSNQKSASFYSRESGVDDYLQKVKDKQTKAEIKDNYQQGIDSYDITTPEIRPTFGMPQTGYNRNKVEPVYDKLESFEEVSAKNKSLIRKLETMETRNNDQHGINYDYKSNPYQLPNQRSANIRQTADYEQNKYAKKYDLASNGMLKTETFQHFQDSQDAQQFPSIPPISPRRFPPKPPIQPTKIDLPKTYEFKDYVDDNASFGSHDSMSDSYGTKKVQISLNPQSGCEDYCKEDFLIPKNLRAMPSQSLDKLLELDDPEPEIKQSYADQINFRGKLFYRNTVH